MRGVCFMLYFSLVISAVLIARIKCELCPDVYHRFSVKHTGCLLPNITCVVLQSGVSAEDIETILQVHNKYRSKIAIGKETALPKAANMLQMVWDWELTQVAQHHANQCKFSHDCNECRQVKNFRVGQNLYQGKTSSPILTPPDWVAAVKSWYDEVEYFKKNYIDPFISSSGELTYGHFTQLAWADSWRVGCGYTRFLEGTDFVTLYTCNYGPGGNIKEDKLYEKGEPCSHCPANSCCDKSCSVQNIVAEYPGLCKIVDDKAPTYKPVESFIFNCGFEEEGDCQTQVTEGAKKWEVQHTFSGSYLSAVLNGGESSTLNFTTPFCGKESICVSLYYRKGPNTDGEEASSTLTEHFLIPSVGHQTQVLLENDDVQFEKFSMSLGWNMETTLALSFSVPPGKPAQYAEMKDLTVKEGPCE